MFSVEQATEPDHLECQAEIRVLEEKLRVAESEVRILLSRKRELESQIADLSQRRLDVISILDEYIDSCIDWPPLAKMQIRIRVALHIGDD